jgi:hypothetical protein
MKYVAFFFSAILCLMGLASASHAQLHLNEILADPGKDWNSDGTVDSKPMSGSRSSTPARRRWISRRIDFGCGGNRRFALRDWNAGAGPDQGLLRLGRGGVAAANGVSQLGLSLNNSGDTVFSTGSPATPRRETVQRTLRECSMTAPGPAAQRNGKLGDLTDSIRTRAPSHPPSGCAPSRAKSQLPDADTRRTGPGEVAHKG